MPITTTELTLTTLTPLWTGGIDGATDRIHETGLIGSLRWWYEAIVRGFGGWACDPSQHLCSVEQGLCAACQLFGATGWRRRFRLLVINDQTTPAWQGNQLLNIRPPGRSRGWFLPPGRVGKLSLRVTGEETAVATILALLQFLARWGSIGAKPQLGYGFVNLTLPAPIEAPLPALSVSKSSPAQQQQSQNWPSLQHIGFLRYRFQPSNPAWWSKIAGMERVITQIRPLAARGMVPIAPILKNRWRFQHWQKKWGDERLFWGSVSHERRRGQMGVSWAYQTDAGWEIRGWAWLAGLRQPAAVWKMLATPAIWDETLGVTGELTTFPNDPWQPWSPATINTLF